MKYNYYNLFEYKKNYLNIQCLTVSCRVKISSSRAKKITSGGKNKISGRKFMSGEYEEFRWTATPFVNCNDGEFVKIKATDSALLNRLKVVPFRSRFDFETENDPSTYTYKINTDFVEKIMSLHDTHFYVLLDAYRKYKCERYIKEPEFSVVFKEGLIQSSDALYGAVCEFIEEHCEITENETDDISRKEFITNFREIYEQYRNPSKYQTTNVFNLFKKALHNKCIETLNRRKKAGEKERTNLHIGIKLKPISKSEKSISTNGYEKLFSR